jgi:hypothetical protein
MKIESTSVINNERSALKAVVKVNLSLPAQARVKFWPEGTTQENAKVSVVSSESRDHAIPLFDLQENTTYHYKVVINNENSDQSEEILSFTTASIPTFVKEFYKESENQIVEQSEGYYLFASMTKPGSLYLVDKKGKIAWYRTTPNVIKAARLTKNNTVITLEDNTDNPMGDGNIILETSWAGDTVFYQTFGQGGFDKVAHHDVQLHPNGNMVFITNEMKDGLPGDGLLVLNRQGKKIWSWSTFDEITDIDLSTYKQPWGNSLFIDKDNNYIVSFRSLSQVWKINGTTGDVMWKLGKNGNVTMNVESQFMFQHFAHRNKNDEIMLFDNGDATRPQSRLISFTINESAKEATTRIDKFLPAEFYSMIMGSTSVLPDNTLLAASAVNGKIIKLDESGSVLWSLKTASRIYRVEYVIDPFDTEVSEH